MCNNIWCDLFILTRNSASKYWNAVSYTLHASSEREKINRQGGGDGKLEREADEVFFK